MAESKRHFDHAVVPVQLDYVACPRKDRAASLASADVFVHGSAQPGLYFAVEIIRNLAPHLFAIHYHGFVPFPKDILLIHGPPNPGASRSRNISRARSKRVFTDAVEIFNASAVSSMLKCCMSRRTNTSR